MTSRLIPKIRPAKPDDAEVVARIYIDSWNAGFGELMSQANRTVTAELVERWKNYLAQLVPHRWWVAEHLGSIVGMVGIGPSRDPVDPQLGELYTIAIDPPYWRKGIGRALISLALQHLVSDGYREAILWTVKGYERGIAFYEAMGWKCDGGVRDNGRQIRFRRDLAPFRMRPSTTHSIKDGIMKSADDVYTVLGKIGLDTSHLRKVEPIQKRHGNRLFRITHGSSSYILKLFGNPDASSEVRAYALLKDLGVPTLHTIATRNDALLMEDLEASKLLRLAGEDDVVKAEVGVTLAAWYRALHHAGSRLSTDQTEFSFLRREIDELTPASTLEVASRVGGADRSKWANLADNIDRVKNAAMNLEETLTYNDFHWTNLALSRNGKPIRAVMFDFHLLGVGLRYSDCRNVTGSLGPDAVDAFWSAYGDTDAREKILDDLLAPLYALVEAFRRPKFPSWAEESLELAKTGEIHSRLGRVMEML